MEPKSIDQVFWDAARLASPGERAEYLDRACAGNPELRKQVEELLEARAAAGSFLETPAVVRPGGAAGDGDTRTGPSVPDGDLPLDFLAPSDKPGSLGRLGHYEVWEVIGRGGMGVVLKAFDANLHRVVAIKVMAPQLAATATARKRFAREARAAAAVTHEHVITIHAVEESGPLPHIVMQFVAGQSLQDRLDRSGPLPVAEILRIGMQAAAGLAAAHAQGLVHRDVKPANILLENGVERVKLTDFGLARAADDASLTQSGTVAGTPQYMSPEQAEGKAVDARSDLFSLGSVLYAMCAGRPPFRAPSSMAVLKRVCEEIPTPLREVNPEVPEWLAEVIAKLHAKDPAARFQSAAEVAELLGRHLAHLQHPCVAPLPAIVKPTVAPQPAVPLPPARRGRRWAAAAAALALLVAGLGATEATGVTRLRATVVRIFTPDGLLAVETDDPSVKVTVEGDGDLVITGAGPQEVRLRPGSYRLHAVKDGKAVRLDRDLVTITRGDRQVVKVRVEGGMPATVTPKAEAGAFVVLGGKGTGERRFDTLAEAVQGAGDGDTVEVRGNGPFVSEPIDLGNTPLVIRAGPGFRPVIRHGPEGSQAGAPLLRTAAPLVLEGLELQRFGRNLTTPSQPRIIDTLGQSLHASNCRFRVTTTGPVHICVYAGSPLVVLRNCEFLNPSAVSLAGPAGRRWVVENCLHVGSSGLAIEHYEFTEADSCVTLTKNTFATAFEPIGIGLFHARRPSTDEKGATPVRIEASDCVFSAPFVLAIDQLGDYTKKPGPLKPDEMEQLLPHLLAWSDRGNVFGPGAASVSWKVVNRPESPHGPKSFTEWKKFWGDDGGEALEGRVRFRGGNLLARLAADPDKLTPEDFRLRPDSAGHRAGKDGKDLGADVDLVGPGAGYERWKKTPDYREWLKETKQVK